MRPKEMSAALQPDLTIQQSKVLGGLPTPCRTNPQQAVALQILAGYSPEFKMNVQKTAQAFTMSQRQASASSMQFKLAKPKALTTANAKFSAKGRAPKDICRGRLIFDDGGLDTCFELGARLGSFFGQSGFSIKEISEVSSQTVDKKTKMRRSWVKVVLSKPMVVAGVLVTALAEIQITNRQTHEWLHEDSENYHSAEVRGR